ncbi:MAG: cellobiose phosphorylase [Candidatus Omnitrophica bacterium]|nr:cellobiose phosphorylase [Candidatus Omnitrophota bacterium]
MIYEFIDQQGTFKLKNPNDYDAYFPLTNSKGSILSSISPNLSGDIKTDNDHFITPPASSVDLKTNLLCRRDFFIQLKNQTLRLSHPYNDTLEAGFLYHKLIKKTKGLEIEILNFIPHNLGCEVMQVKIKNKTKSSLEITPTSFIPLYGRSAENIRDHRHVSSLLNRIKLTKYTISLKPTMIFNESGHQLNKTEYFSIAFEDNKRPALGQFPTLDYFLGQGDLLNPESLQGKIKPLNKEMPFLQGKEALACFRFKKKLLKPNQQVSYYLLSGIGSPESFFKKLNSPSKIDKAFSETKKYWLNHLSLPQLNFKDKTYNNWLKWVKLQPTLRKLFGNSFLPHFDYGKGGRGWRDLWQDALALLFIEPKKTKQLILNNFQGVRLDGSNATIITKDGRMIPDRNNISRVWMDHGVWPWLTLKLYLDKTQDLSILRQKVTYFDQQKPYRGTVLEHILIQQLTHFFDVGSHNIIRLRNADWNDGLDMAPDLGESVAFSFMYADNLKSLSLILQKMKKQKVYLLKEIVILLDQITKPIDYNNFREKQKRLKLFLQKTKNISGQKQEITLRGLIIDLEKKSQHLSAWLREKEWLKQGFFNGYYDNKGKRVEGKIKGKLRMMLASQVFAIMSGVATDQQIKKTWLSINRHLKDKKLGGFRLNTDFGSIYPDLGRAFGFSYGNKENGAFFNHMVVMLGFALCQRGFIREGREVLASIYKMATAKSAKIYPGIPEYFDLSGKGLYLYLTGSASWYIYALLEGTQRKD